ncbi:MAG TPA: methyltransferase domain-containing protein [Planctomycetota bacterium]
MSTPNVPDPMRAAVTAVFDDWARRGRGEGMEEPHRDVVLQMLDRAGIQEDHQVLDVGCGAGWTVRLIAGMAHRGRAFGVDASEAMIERARSHRNPAHVAFTAAPAEQLPYADASLDRVVSMESIYYWSDIPAGLREVWRVLRPGGSWLCAFEYFAENPYTERWAADLGLDLRRHSAAEYESMCRDVGFDEVSSERLVDRRAPKSQNEFQADEYFIDYPDYLKYRATGALLVRGRRPGAV